MSSSKSPASLVLKERLGEGVIVLAIIFNITAGLFIAFDILTIIYDAYKEWQAKKKKQQKTSFDTNKQMDKNPRFSRGNQGMRINTSYVSEKQTETNFKASSIDLNSSSQALYIENQFDNNPQLRSNTHQVRKHNLIPKQGLNHSSLSSQKKSKNLNVSFSRERNTSFAENLDNKLIISSGQFNYHQNNIVEKPKESLKKVSNKKVLGRSIARSKGPVQLNPDINSITATPFENLNSEAFVSVNPYTETKVYSDKFKHIENPTTKEAEQNLNKQNSQTKNLQNIISSKLLQNKPSKINNKPNFHDAVTNAYLKFLKQSETSKNNILHGESNTQNNIHLLNQNIFTSNVQRLNRKEITNPNNSHEAFSYQNDVQNHHGKFPVSLKWKGVEFKEDFG